MLKVHIYQQVYLPAKLSKWSLMPHRKISSPKVPRIYHVMLFFFVTLIQTPLGSIGAVMVGLMSHCNTLNLNLVAFNLKLKFNYTVNLSVANKILRLKGDTCRLMIQTSEHNSAFLRCDISLWKHLHASSIEHSIELTYFQSWAPFVLHYAIVITIYKICQWATSNMQWECNSNVVQRSSSDFKLWELRYNAE